MPRSSPASVSPSVLIDGTALFYAVRQLGDGSQLNYFAFKDLLKESDVDAQANGAWQPSPAYFFTSADPANDGQKKFHHFLQTKVGFTVVELSPKDANIWNPLLWQPGVEPLQFQYTRFDSLIAYSMGALVGAKKSSRIFVCSDSWPLHAPMLDAVERDVPVTFVFFGRAMDARYHGLLRSDSRIGFIDLDDHADALFQRPGATLPPSGRGLVGLFG